MINECKLVGCSNFPASGFEACNRTHGAILDKVRNTQGKIEFYGKQQPYYELTNFYENKRNSNLKMIHYKGNNFKTSEHAFQFEKFNYGSQQAQQVGLQILSAQTPREAFDIAQKNAHLIRINWQEEKDSVMYEIVKSKFSQSSRHLRNVILKTDNAILVEASPLDSYWGYGVNGQGENKLGRILMRVREEMKLNLY
ncbi:MAG: NADAR family protein [Parachlamydiaceae bacterium]|nr:NADAR family protein [Parachlamydiaceae bacterium]